MGETVRIVEGARVTVPEKCGCGSIPKESEIVLAVVEWNRLANQCAFCGRQIKLMAGPIEHVHMAPKEPDAWAIQHPEWEDNVECFSNGPWGDLDIHAHDECASRGMRFAKWGRPPLPDKYPFVDLGDTEVVLESPCDECGARADPADVQRAVNAMYGLRHGSICVYCGRVMKLKMIVLRHRDLCGRHHTRWHWKDWDWEPCATWHWNLVEFIGHLECAKRVLRYAGWWPPREVPKTEGKSET